MGASLVSQALEGLPIGSVRYFHTIDSTNQQAADWAQAGADDLSLVIADEQTAGRGRLGRRWFTPPDAALAFSLVLRPTNPGNDLTGRSSWLINRYTALGALAVCQALRLDYNLSALIKWPNDVLLAGRKAAGVLAEATWLGVQLDSIILGIGVNIKPASVPPDAQVEFPATCVEAISGQRVLPLELLRAILVHLLSWRPKLALPGFIHAWENLLALRGECVEVQALLPSGELQTCSGTIRGLDEGGRLCLQQQSGKMIYLAVGDIRHQAIINNPASEKAYNCF